MTNPYVYGIWVLVPIIVQLRWLNVPTISLCRVWPHHHHHHHHHGDLVEMKLKRCMLPQLALIRVSIFGKSCRDEPREDGFDWRDGDKTHSSNSANLIMDQVLSLQMCITLFFIMRFPSSSCANRYRLHQNMPMINGCGWVLSHMLSTNCSDDELTELRMAVRPNCLPSLSFIYYDLYGMCE